LTLDTALGSRGGGGGETAGAVGILESSGGVALESVV